MADIQAGGMAEDEQFLHRKLELKLQLEKQEGGNLQWKFGPVVLS
uniref:Uncharacterized protein n=1 Tax=Arundo donax TaxID=35708 RepID=A0A0A9SDZ9_ARUDO